MRMKAGGLDMIAVYVFWIHHEESRGVFNFTGPCLPPLVGLYSSTVRYL